MPFESPCDLGARKSFPNTPDYELKLNSGLIVHLAAVSGKGKIDVGITYTDVHQVQLLYHAPRFVPLLSQEKRHGAQKIQFQCLLGGVECAHFSPYKMVTRRARRC